MSSPIFAFNGVMEALFARAMGIEDLGYIVSGGESGKGGVFLQNVGRRIVQEQDEMFITVSLCLFEVSDQTLFLPFDEFLRMLLLVLIVADDPALAVGIERAFKAMAFGSDQGNIAIGLIAVLKKSQTSLIGLVEFCGL